MEHVYIKAATPRLNGKVEHSHLTDKQYYSFEPGTIYGVVDGQKFGVERPTVKARHSRKYFDRGKGLVAYTLLFNHILIKWLRLYRCHCETNNTNSVSLLRELLSENTHPELKYIEAKWASLMSYDLTVDRLKDILPINKVLNASTVRNHLISVAKRQEAE